jgi:hypothetical protein
MSGEHRTDLLSRAGGGYPAGVQWPTFIWMFLILKIPIAALLWLVWYAIHAEPEPAAGESDEGGGPGHSPSPRPRRPIGPRRGDHPLPRTASPSRVRLAARKLTRKA